MRFCLVPVFSDSSLSIDACLDTLSRSCLQLNRLRCRGKQLRRAAREHTGSQTNLCLSWCENFLGGIPEPNQHNERTLATVTSDSSRRYSTGIENGAVLHSRSPRARLASCGAHVHHSELFQDGPGSAWHLSYDLAVLLRSSSL